LHDDHEKRSKNQIDTQGDIEAIKLPNPNGIDLLVLGFSRIGGSAEDQCVV